MLKKLQIRNILSHKNTTLHFTPGLNILIGQTKAGKSAAMNGLSWVLNNRPLGNELQSRWGGHSMVSLETTEGDKIQRIKGKGINEYRLNGTRMEFGGNQNVPEEIRKVLNLGDINVQGQFDRHFLLSASPGEVAEHFSRIARLDDIDNAHKKIQKWTGQFQQDQEKEKANIEKYKQDLKQYENLPGIEARVEELEELKQETLKLESDRDLIENLIGKIKTKKRKIAKIESELKSEEKVNELISLISERDELESRRSSLEDLVSRIKTVQKNIDRYQSRLKLEEKVDNLIELVDKRNELENKLEELGSILSSIGKVQKRIHSKKKQLDRLQEEFNRYSGKVCPLCNGEGTIEKLKYDG